jgi:hypothetical protein
MLGLLSAIAHTPSSLKILATKMIVTMTIAWKKLRRKEGVKKMLGLLYAIIAHTKQLAKND